MGLSNGRGHAPRSGGGPEGSIVASGADSRRPDRGWGARRRAPRDTPDGKSYHEEIVLAAFGSLEETEATLASLGSFLVCISILVWMMAALLLAGSYERRWCH